MDNITESLAKNLAENLIAIRKKSGLSQVQLALKADIPRSTLTYIESGESNPSLSNLAKISSALQISVEELIAKTRASIKLIKASDIPVVIKSKSQVSVEKLLPDPIPGMEIDRMTFAPGGRLKGTPHITRTKEYFYCSEGSVNIYVGKNQFEVKKGDVLVFPGDEPHAYHNLSSNKKAVCFSVVVFAPYGL